MNIDKLKDIIEEVNDGNWDDYSQFFNNDIELFIKIVEKYGLIDLINPMSDELSEYQNLILYALVNQNPEKWVNFICENIINSDLIKKDDGWYLYLDEQSELSELFYEGHRDSTRSVVKSVLSEDGWEPYWETTDDVYRDVVEELNKENLSHLLNLLLSELEGTTIEAETEHLEDLNESDSGEIVVTKENFPKIIEDEETLKYLLKTKSNYIWDELYSVHSNCYNSAYQDEIYDDIWGELSIFFEGRAQWESRPYKYNPEKTQYYNIVKIRDIASDIKTYLYEFKNSGYSQDSLEYYGSYLGMLKNGMNDSVWRYLDFRIPEYPDFRRVDTCINDTFTEHL